MSKKIIFISLFMCFVHIVYAQDTRHVNQPKIPKTCITLSADKFVGADRNMSASDETKLDTQRIQQALDTCAKGLAVKLIGTDENAFLSGPLELRDGVSLIIDKGITVYASRNPNDYDYPNAPKVCGTLEAQNRSFSDKAISDKQKPKMTMGCRPLIHIVNVKNTAVMGQGTIDGRGDKTLIGRDYSWWQMARKAEPGDKKYYSMRLIVAKHADGLILYGISLHNSPNFHITVNETNGFTAWGLHLLTPTVAGTDARNTDGIDPGNSTNITLAHNWIHNDDDNVAIKNNISNMSVIHNHFYNGHGMSIGSGTSDGISNLLVDDLIMDHTTSGIRIKSNVTRGGKVSHATYQNICMKDVGVPVAITPYYNNGTTEKFEDPGIIGNKIPDYKDITLKNITAITSGEVLIAGFDQQHRTQIQFDNVNIVGITPKQAHAKLADISIRNSNIDFSQLTDKDLVSVKNLAATTAKKYNCDHKFIPMQ